MHLRGTHCVRSDGKNQISRAQCRWNNETARDKAELSVEEIARAVAGSVHTRSLGTKAVKSMEALLEAGAAVSGMASDLDCSTQQQVFWGVQQPHFSTDGAEVV